jgi:thioredoxin-related protein
MVDTSKTERTDGLSPEPPRAARRTRTWAVLLLLALGLSVLYLVTGRGRATPAGWLTDLDQARRQAAESGRLLFVEFGAAWCVPCRLMEQEVFPNPRVREALKLFVTVHVDADAQPATAARYHIEGLPTMIVMDHQGTVRARWSGGLPVDELLRFLQRASESDGALRTDEPNRDPQTEPRP